MDNMQAIDQTMNNMTLETNIGGHNLECHNDMVSHNSFEQKSNCRENRKNFHGFYFSRSLDMSTQN